jgi:microcystin-dependent protein
MIVVKVLKSTLSSPLSSTGTSITVKECVDSQGNAVALADFGAQSYFVVVIKQGDTTEIVKCSALAQNSDGTATFTVASSGRDILPKSPYTGSSTGEDFQTGAEVIFTNDPLSMSTFANVQEANTFTGIQTFDESALPRLSAQHTYGAGDEEKLATYRVVADTANAGTVDASTTQKGIVEEATEAEIEAGTAAGGTSARLVVNPNTLKSSDYGTAVYNRNNDYAADAGSNDTYVITLTPAPTSYTTGMMIRFKPNTRNTGACTINVNGLGNKSIKKEGTLDPADGDLEAGQIYNLVYDGTNFQLMNLKGSIPTGSLMMWLAPSAPSGWLLADGSAVSRSTYATLFAVLYPTLGTVTITIAAPGVVSLTSHGMATGDAIYLTTTGALPTGLSVNTKYWVIKNDADSFWLATSLANALAATKITTSGSQSGTHTAVRCPYGVGDGSTTFNLPSLKGAVAAGVDQTQTEFAGLGQTGGEKTHTLTVAEMPSHQHAVQVYDTGGGVGGNLVQGRNGSSLSMGSTMKQTELD